MPRSHQPSETTIRGLIITSPRTVSLKHFNLFETDKDLVRVRVQACGLCTWEQRVYRGAKRTYPFWGGHEVCGTVEKVNGANPNSYRIGDSVALALMRRCGECSYCKRGLDNHCVYVRPEPMGVVPAGPRGLSDFLLVPSYQVFRLNPQVPATHGAMVEPLACVLHSVDKGRVSIANTVVVIGSGTMGLLHATLLRHCGCKVLMAGDDSDVSRALSAGADMFFSLDMENIETEIRHATQGIGADAVFCTRGGVDGVELAVKIVARGGRIVLYQSITGPDNYSVGLNGLHYREIEIVGSISQTLSDFQRAADLVSANPSLLNHLAIEIVDASEAEKAFEKALDPKLHRVFVSFT